MKIIRNEKQIKRNANIGKFTKMRIKAPCQQSKPSHLIDILSASYKDAVMAMLEQIRLAHNDNWKQTSKEAGLFWLRVMKERILIERTQRQ